MSGGCESSVLPCNLQLVCMTFVSLSELPRSAHPIQEGPGLVVVVATLRARAEDLTVLDPACPHLRHVVDGSSLGRRLLAVFQEF
mgnify:CR=1 FL=1